MSVFLALSAVQASEDEIRISRDARLKRFEEQKRSYADIMKEAAGGWSPDDSRMGGGDGAAASDGLRHRGGGT